MNIHNQVILVQLLSIVQKACAGHRAKKHAYVSNPVNCWKGCGNKGGRCPSVCGTGGSCCRRGWPGCGKGMAGVAPTNYHACVKYRRVKSARKYSIAYLSNPLNCWKGCGKKGGRCPSVCGKGGCCCRRGWAGCGKGMGGVAPANYHACVKYRSVKSSRKHSIAYVSNPVSCWKDCGSKGGSCPSVCGTGGFCCRRGWAGCSKDMTGVAPANYHTCVKYGTIKSARKHSSSRSAVAWQITCNIAIFLFIVTLWKLIRYHKRARATQNTTTRETRAQEPPTVRPVYVISGNSNDEGGLVTLRPPDYHSLFPSSAKVVVPNTTADQEGLPPPYS